MLSLVAIWTNEFENFLPAKKCAIYAALCNKGDCALYACSTSCGDDWGKLYAADHTKELEQDDGSKVSTAINEAATLKHYVDNDMSKASPTQGIWMGGNQYKVTKRDADFEVGEAKTKCIHVVAPLKGSKKQG